MRSLQHRTRFGAAVAAVFFFALGFGGIVATPARAVAASQAPDTSHDAELKTFLQKRFRIPNGAQIKLGAPSPSGISGLWVRTVSVTNDQGQTINATLFTDATGAKVILGQLLDTTKDPWGRVDLKAAHLDDRASLGPADAPVTLIEFGDLECPFCARALNILETMVNGQYKGRVHLIFKNFPLAGHLWAREAATGAECARLQNPQAFWGMARDFYRDQAQINPKNVRQHIDDYAKSLKLDTAALSTCMMSKAAAARIEQDVQDGEALHVVSTPTFFVNGIPVVGFPDAKALQFVIDSELASHRTAAARR